MPTVLRAYGYRFHFYSDEGNEPPHIHIDGNGAKAKIWLSDLSIAKSAGFNQSALTKVTAVVAENRELFLEAWNEYFN